MKAKKGWGIRRRVTIALYAVEDAALSNLKGRPIRPRGMDRSYENFGENHQLENARQLACIFEEAVYALEDFVEQHGYLPRQPRFDVVMNDDGTPAEPRRFQRVNEMRAVEDALALAQKQADGKADDR
jgi:hypothetical protein